MSTGQLLLRAQWRGNEGRGGTEVTQTETEREGGGKGGREVEREGGAGDGGRDEGTEGEGEWETG